MSGRPSNFVTAGDIEKGAQDNQDYQTKATSSADIPSPLSITRPLIKVTLPPQSPSSHPEVTRPLPDAPGTAFQGKGHTSNIDANMDASAADTITDTITAPEIFKERMVLEERREHLTAATEFWKKIQQHRKHGSITLSSTSPLSLDGLIAVACHNVTVNLDVSGPVAERLQDACDILAGSVNSDSLLYADLAYIEERISSFQGPSRKRKVWEGKETPPGSMPKAWMRAAMVSFIALVLQGRSFVKLQTLQMIVHCLNNDITPLVPIGDETEWSSFTGPMGYVAAMIQGSRKVVIQLGEKNNYKPYTANQGLQRCKLPPIQLSNFESYMITHSAAFQFGVSTVGVCQTHQLVYNCQLLTAFTLDVAERDAEWADDRADEPPIYREIRANIRAFTRGSANIYGKEKKDDDDDPFENTYTTQLYIEAFCSFPYQLSSVLQDLKLAREQLESIVSNVASGTHDGVDKLVEALFCENRFAGSDESDDENASNESNPGSSALSEKGGLAAQLENQRLARRIIETLEAYTHGGMFDIISCMQKTRNSLATILQQSHTSVWSLTDPSANNMALPDKLAYNGKGSSPVIEQCVNEIQDIDAQVGHLMSTFIKHERYEGTLQTRHNDAGHVRYVAAHSVISVGQITAMITRQMATQSYVLAQAADLRSIHDRILISGFERVIVNSMPLLGPKIYAQLSQDLIHSIRHSLLSAVKKSWAETSQAKPAMLLEDRCTRAADAAVPVMIEYLTGCQLSDVSGTFAEWRRNAAERFQHWIAYWPKVLKTESEKDMATASKLVYLLVREKCGVKVDKSGIARAEVQSPSSPSSPEKDDDYGSSPSKADPKGKGRDRVKTKKVPNPHGIPAPVTKIYEALRAGALDDIVMKILIDDLSTPLPAAISNKDKTKKLAKEKVRDRTDTLLEATGHSKKPRMMEPFPPPTPLPGLVADGGLPLPSPLNLDRPSPFGEYDPFEPSPELTSPISPTTPTTPTTPTRPSALPTNTAGNVSIYEDPAAEVHTPSVPSGFGLLNSPIPNTPPGYGLLHGPLPPFLTPRQISSIMRSPASSPALVMPPGDENLAPSGSSDAMDTDEPMSSPSVGVAGAAPLGEPAADARGGNRREADAAFWEEARRELHARRFDSETEGEKEAEA